MIEFDKQYTLIENSGEISASGVLEIRRFIEAQDLRSDEWSKHNPSLTHHYLPPLDYQWDYKWLVERGEYRGKFATRVSHYYYKSFGIKCPASFLERIGNIARENLQSASVFRFDFTNEIDWRQGEYGESYDSCYWWNGEAALDMLRNNGGFAVRFYNEAGEGFARAWMYELGDSVYVLWNGYGLTGYSTLVAARVVAAHLNASYRQISLENHGRTGGTLYINSGAGYTIGALKDIEGINYYDFEWEGDCEDRCYECGDCLEEGDLYFGADDNVYCERHYYDLFDNCEHCGETHYRDDMTHTDDTTVCEYCLDRLYVACETCGEYIRKTKALRRRKKMYCENCYEK
jgi:hypothetical protein